MKIDTDSRMVDRWLAAECRFELWLSPDELRCWLSLSPVSGKPALSVDQLRGELIAHAVNTGLIEEAIAHCCSELQQGRPVNQHLIAVGVAPKAHEPAKIQFDVFLVTSDARALLSDHVVAAGKGRLYENVFAQQEIGFLIPEVPGVDGFTVGGRSLPPAALRAAPAITVGEGALLMEQGVILAQMDGRVVFENGVVSVSNELIIAEDVDYEVGSIDFVGFVQVRRSVRSGYTVRARLGLTVGHIVEHTHIESEGDIQLGGMAGNDKTGTVVCGGNLTARYLHDVRVECAGNAVITSEVMNCRLYVAGSLMVNGLIAGGEAIALGGIETGRLGSDAGERTFVRAGVDYRHLEALHHISEEWAALFSRQQELELQKETADCDAVATIEQKLETVSRRLSLLKEERKAIYQLFEGQKNAKINVKRALFEGVVIQLGAVQELFSDYRKGSYSIIEYAERELAFLPLTPLSVNAGQLERDLKQREADSH
jgi:uncharacterized protein